MADAGFFKGTSIEQDGRYANKQKKLLQQMKFPENIDVKVKRSIDEKNGICSLTNLDRHGQSEIRCAQTVDHTTFGGIIRNGG